MTENPLPRPDQDAEFVGLVSDLRSARDRALEYAARRSKEERDAGVRRQPFALLGPPWEDAYYDLERTGDLLECAMTRIPPQVRYNREFLVPCPFCNAEPFTYCRTRSRDRLSINGTDAFHRARSAALRASDVALGENARSDSD